ncbi:pyridoxamine 5'-phosphate oxidase family protein [Spiractinospora alimapuensis]|uniref:pyridoxamine 5'-phosphate oxidase family protein n=1 Tax=Spiractinospora alimapuensis TaxID=2820884 RepID=UPI001F2F081B|nr:pyridoxamine 5'-phosphate oxidase family protein [Spiractinospora alimapuensis]QVQ54150.1 pyridoxamine 5'-phosphate oxidase family protein [Spiractinospora alimapuensis]
MSTQEPITEIDTRFSSQGALALPWSDVVDLIHAADIFWLSTVRRDGRPHVTPLPAMWLDGALHFCTGPGEQKAVNLGRNPACVLTTGTNVFGSGTDVVVEGSAVRVTDRALLERLARMWREKLDWPFEATDDGFRESTSELAGQEFDDRGSAHVFAVAPAKVLTFHKGEPFSQTRYRFR